jgi:hypothetical protein
MKLGLCILLSLVQLLSAVQYNYDGQIMKLGNGNNVLSDVQITLDEKTLKFKDKKTSNITTFMF